MLSKNPLEPLSGINENRVSEAIRLAAIAELDAINLYLQLASGINDESIRKVLFDVANEEKTHFGEFLELLKKYDKEQITELEKGSKEVSSLLNSISPIVQESNTKNDIKADPIGPLNAEETNLILSLIEQNVSQNASLSSSLSKLVMGDGILAIPSETITEGEIIKTSSKIIEMQKLSVNFSIEQDLLNYFRRYSKNAIPSSVLKASSILAQQEDTFIANAISSASKIRIQGKWSSPGEFVNLISKAINQMNPKSQLTLIISPMDKAYLSSIIDPSGIDEFSRVNRIVDKIIISQGLKDGEVLLISNKPENIDIVYGSRNRVDYIGLQNSSHVFVLWETLSVRVKTSSAISVINKSE